MEREMIDWMIYGMMAFGAASWLMGALMGKLVLSLETGLNRWAGRNFHRSGR
jgi:hypothetical protein